MGEKKIVGFESHQKKKTGMCEEIHCQHEQNHVHQTRLVKYCLLVWELKMLKLATIK